MHVYRFAGVMLGCLAVCGCQKQAAPAQQHTYVRTETARLVDYAPTVTLTGEIKARHQSDLAFRVPGRIVERLVDPGAAVTRGQPLARLDPQEQEFDLDAARAGLNAAQAQLRQAQATYDRQKQLIGQGFTTRREHDAAEAAYRAALGAMEAAQAQLSAAEDTRGYTTLAASAAGVITARLAEVGQVVQAAQPVFTLAQDGERDAIFAVQEALFLRKPDGDTVRIALAADTGIVTTGKVREISPSVDTTTGTVRVTVGLDYAPPAMVLGAVVTGSVQLKARPAFIVPAAAITVSADVPAIWVLEGGSTAALRPVSVLAHETGRAVLSVGVKEGDVIITDGTKLLRPGQTVQVLAEKP